MTVGLRKSHSHGDREKDHLANRDVRLECQFQYSTMRGRDRKLCRKFSVTSYPADPHAGGRNRAEGCGAADRYPFHREIRDRGMTTTIPRPGTLSTRSVVVSRRAKNVVLSLPVRTGPLSSFIAVLVANMSQGSTLRRPLPVEIRGVARYFSD